MQLARVAAQIWDSVEPAVLLLDEPTSALDLAQQESLLGLVRGLRQRGAAVVAVLHDLNLAARHADRIAMLQAGRMVCLGSPHQALRPAVLRQVFGVETDTLRCPRDGRPIVVIHGLDAARADD